MSDNNGNGGSMTVPYPSWVSMKSFIGDLAEKGLPHRIDHTVMKGKSGATQSALKGAFTFLGLIDEHGTPTDRLKSLRTKFNDDEAWRSALGDLVMEAYAPVVGDLSLKTGTAKQLADRFRESGQVSGSTLTRAVRFYLAVLDEAGIERSQYFAAPPRPKSSRKPRVSTKAGGDDPDDDEVAARDDDTPEVPKGWVIQPFNLPGRPEPVQFIMPADLKVAEWKMIDAYMTLYVGDETRNKPSPSDRSEDEG